MKVKITFGIGMVLCMELCSLPQNSHVETLTPVSQYVTVFGDRALMK